MSRPRFSESSAFGIQFAGGKAPDELADYLDLLILGLMSKRWVVVEFEDTLGELPNRFVITTDIEPDRGDPQAAVTPVAFITIHQADIEAVGIGGRFKPKIPVVETQVGQLFCGPVANYRALRKHEFDAFDVCKECGYRKGAAVNH